MRKKHRELALRFVPQRREEKRRLEKLKGIIQFFLIFILVSASMTALGIAESQKPSQQPISLALSSSGFAFPFCSYVSHGGTIYILDPSTGAIVEQEHVNNQKGILFFCTLENFVPSEVIWISEYQTGSPLIKLQINQGLAFIRDFYGTFGSNATMYYGGGYTCSPNGEFSCPIWLYIEGLNF